MYNNLKNLIVIALLLNYYSNIGGQVEKEHLNPLLSLTDQKKIEKIEGIILKGKKIENEAKILLESGSSDKEKAKSEKKYTLKRLEAAEYYQKGNELFIHFMKESLSNLRKKNKNLQVLSSIKNKEDRAGELQRNARSLRRMAEDLIYPAEKLDKMIEAEKLETEASNTYVKVLYAYLNQPIAYDILKNEQKMAEKTSTIPADTFSNQKTSDLKSPKPASVHSDQKAPVITTKEEPNSPAIVPATVLPVEPVTEIPKTVASVNTALSPDAEKVIASAKEPEKKPETTALSVNKTTIEPKKEIPSPRTNLVFKVQIVASKAPLSKSEQQKIYSGQYPVEEALEAGWYKYSVVTGSEFNEAKVFMAKEKIQGAFIKAYLGNKRIDIKEALNL
jgi:hypothetical protein